MAKHQQTYHHQKSSQQAQYKNHFWPPSLGILCPQRVGRIPHQQEPGLHATNTCKSILRERVLLVFKRSAAMLGAVLGLVGAAGCGASPTARTTIEQTMPSNAAVIFFPFHTRLGHGNTAYFYTLQGYVQISVVRRQSHHWEIVDSSSIATTSGCPNPETVDTAPLMILRPTENFVFGRTVGSKPVTGMVFAINGHRYPTHLLKDGFWMANVGRRVPSGVVTLQVLGANQKPVPACSF